MGSSRVTVGLMIAIAGCIGMPGTLLAADYQVQAPGYAAPDQNGPWTPIPDLAVPKLQAEPPAPELSFRDRLKQLDNAGAAVPMQPGFTTRDTTSSYSASAGPGFTTQNTTSSFTTGPDAKP
jgi:hypothetical protein